MVWSGSAPLTGSDCPSAGILAFELQDKDSVGKPDGASQPCQPCLPSSHSQALPAPTALSAHIVQCNRPNHGFPCCLKASPSSLFSFLFSPFLSYMHKDQ